MSKSKRKNQRVHAKRRALERHGFTLNRHDLRDLVLQIQRGTEGVEMIEKRSNRVSIWRVLVQGKAVRVVYDRNRKTIVTFLPEIDTREVA